MRAALILLCLAGCSVEVSPAAPERPEVAPDLLSCPATPPAPKPAPPPPRTTESIGDYANRATTAYRATAEALRVCQGRMEQVREALSRP